MSDEMRDYVLQPGFTHYGIAVDQKKNARGGTVRRGTMSRLAAGTVCKLTPSQALAFKDRFISVAVVEAIAADAVINAEKALKAANVTQKEALATRAALEASKKAKIG